jgi:hypothetical protein
LSWIILKRLSLAEIKIRVLWNHLNLSNTTVWVNSFRLFVKFCFIVLCHVPHVTSYTDMPSEYLFRHAKWAFIQICQVSIYSDIPSEHLFRYAKWAFIQICQVSNYSDMPSEQLFRYANWAFIQICQVSIYSDMQSEQLFRYAKWAFIQMNNWSFDMSE